MRAKIWTHQFSCKCLILNNRKEQLGKFDARANEGIFLGYTTNSHAYKVYNKRLMIVEESMHVLFDESNSKLQDQVLKDANEEYIVLEKQFGTGNESAEKEK